MLFSSFDIKDKVLIGHLQYHVNDLTNFDLK
jgi:hypothetical protein